MSYEENNKYPSANEIVLYKVTEVTEVGVMVTLPDYPASNAMIITAEFGDRLNPPKSRKRPVWFVGKYGAAEVMRVEVAKGYVDLYSRTLEELGDEMKEQLRHLIEASKR